MSIGRDGLPQGNPNVCSDPYQPTFWLGKPGTLTQLRVPNADYARMLDDKYAVHSLLDGQAADRSPYACRTWSFTHEWLKPDVATIFFEYATRQRGFGPFIFVDPHAKNLLTPNQASGTDALHTTEGFAVTGTGEALSSSTEWFQQGERSLAWTLSPPVTGSGGLLRVVAPSGLYGWCMPINARFAFSGYIKQGIGADISVSATPRVVLMNGSGQVQSIVSGTTIVTVTGAAQAFCVTGTVPVASLGTYLEPQISVTGASVTGASVVLLDQLQFEIAPTGQCSTWEYGQGQQLVSVRVDGETVPRVLRSSIGYVITEVT